MKICVVRHGETELNIKKVYYGNLDPKLNDKGVYQAEKAGTVLKKICFDKCFVSGKIRAEETINIITNGRYNSEIDSRLNERNMGIFEGKTYEEIKKIYPLQCKLWTTSWKEYTPDGGESYLDFYNRVSLFMKEIERCKYDNVLIVTHGGVLRCMYCYVLNENPELFWKFSSENGDITLLKYEYENWYVDSITHSN